MTESLYDPELHKLRSCNSPCRNYMEDVELQRIVDIVQGDIVSLRLRHVIDASESR